MGKMLINVIANKRKGETGDKVFENVQVRFSSVYRNR